MRVWSSVERLWRRWSGLRRQWLLLAAAVAAQNLAVLHHTQGAKVSVIGLLIWAGALICLEDRLARLRPQPAPLQLLLAMPLLLWVLWRTGLAGHWDGVVFAMAPVAGLALVLLGMPWRQCHLARESLLCLLLLPVYPLLLRVLPELPLSVAGAQGAGALLSCLGWAVRVQGRMVLLPGGGVQVLAACNGLDMIAQLLCVTTLFLLAFPLRSWRSRIAILLLTPWIGWFTNVLRLALLAALAGVGQGKGTFWFDFFHDQAGSLVFSGLATLLLGWVYLRLLERQLAAVVPPQAVAVQEVRS